LNPVARLCFSAAAALAVASFGFARAANAQTINIPNAGFLSWNSCYGAPGASNALQYACDGSLDGNPRVLAASFQVPKTTPPGAPPKTFQAYTGEVFIKIRPSTSGLLPDYWRISGYLIVPGTGDPCRVGAVTFAGTGPGITDPVHCADWYSSDPSFSGLVLSWPPAADYLWVDSGFSIGSNRTLAEGTKYSAGAVLFDPVPDGCAGCEQEMCIELVSIQLVGEHGFPILNLTGSNSTSVVTWQGSIPGICFGATPAHNRTWGAVKSMYR